MAMTPQKWRTRIRRSLELQKVRKDEVKRFKRGYAGDYAIEPRKKLDENKDEVSVNFIFTYIETVRPTIVPGTPKAFVEGLDPESEAAERHYQAVINHYVRTLGLKTDLKKCVDDWFYSWCAFLTEWEYHEELQFEEDGKTPIYQVKEDANGNPLTDENGDPVHELDENGEPIQDFKIVRDRPIAKWIDPWDVALDCDSKIRKEDTWRGYRMVLLWSEFKAMPAVKALPPELRKKFRPQQLPRDLIRQPMGEDDRNTATERNWVVLWRIYDLETNCIYLLPDKEGLDFFVEEKEWPFEFDVGGDRFPITILESKQDAENPYSFSGFKAYWPQIQERNRLRTMLQSTTRRSAPGWVGKKGIMDEEQKQKFTAAKIGEYVESNGDPKNIIPRPLPQLNAGFFAWDKTVGDDVNMVSSLNEFAAGGQLADTATEASILDAKASVRKGEAKADFADFVAVICSKIGQLAQQFLTVPLAVKIRNPKAPGELSWLKVTGEHIQGEFHLWVEPGADDRKTEGLYRQQTLKGAEILANNPYVDQKKLAVKLARVFDWEQDDILKSDDQFAAEQAAMAAQKQAELDVKRKPEHPDVQFKPIDVSTLAPEIQAFVVHAAMKQNDAIPDAITGKGLPGLPQGGIPGLAPGPASPSMAGPGGPPSSVMPQGAANQTVPVNNSADMPPPTPVGPASEFQGG